MVRLYSQGFEISAGYLGNTFYPAPDIFNEGHSTEIAASGSDGISLGFAFDDINKKEWPLRFTVRVDIYGGDFSVLYGEKFTYEKGSMSTDKATVNFGFSFFNFRLIDRLRLNIFGLDFGLLLYQSSSGNREYREYYSQINPIDVSEERNGDDWVSKGYFGFINRIAYEIPLTDHWLLVPQSEIYFGRTTEFRFNDMKIRSRRVMFKIGIIRNFKS